MTTTGMSYQTPRTGKHDETKRKPNQQEPPNIVICFRSLQQKDESKSEKKKTSKSGSSAKECELRSGVLYVGCDCERRNGLQDECPRSQCHGSPECLTMPPTCPPSKFANGKHLQKKTDALLKRRKAALSLNKKTEEKTKSVHYECFPVDYLLDEKGTCPICCRPMDQHAEIKKTKMPPDLMKPVNFDVPLHCMCK